MGIERMTLIQEKEVAPYLSRCGDYRRCSERVKNFALAQNKLHDLDALS